MLENIRHRSLTYNHPSSHADIYYERVYQEKPTTSRPEGYISDVKTRCRKQALLTRSTDSYFTRYSYMMMACITSSESLREKGLLVSGCIVARLRIWSFS